jgi:DNA-binding XRE family transcriptional regulator
MKTHQQYLKEQLKNDEFKREYDIELKLAKIAIEIQEARSKANLTQKELAKKAHLTQQQVSAIENGSNATISTYLMVCNALKINLRLA